MSIFSKAIVLKETERGYASPQKEVSAIFRVEIESGVCKLFLSVINLNGKTDGEYYLAFLDGKGKASFFPLPPRPSAFNAPLSFLPEVERGFSAGIFFVKSFMPTVVCFGAYMPEANSQACLKRAIADKCLKDFQREKTAPYDDEAVATEDYFQLDAQIAQKIDLARKCDEDLQNEYAEIVSSRKEETDQKPNDACLLQNEESAAASQKPEAQKLINLEEVDRLFETFPEDFSLKGSIPCSRWVKITYEEERFYLVGKVEQEGQLKYICYGLPCNYGEEQPPQLRGLASFVPISLFDLKGRGFWMLFQDVNNGACIKKS